MVGAFPRVLAAGFGAIFGAAFGVGWTPRAPRLYDVAIDPSFTPDETRAIERACKDWEAVAPGLRLYVGGTGHASIHVAPATTEQLAEDMGASGTTNTLAVTWPMNDRSFTEAREVRLDVARLDAAPYVAVEDPDTTSGPSLESVTAHELGHAMGLFHSTRLGVIMTDGLWQCATAEHTLDTCPASLVQVRAALRPTRWDVLAWIALRVR